VCLQEAGVGGGVARECWQGEAADVAADEVQRRAQPACSRGEDTQRRSGEMHGQQATTAPTQSPRPQSVPSLTTIKLLQYCKNYAVYFVEICTADVE